MFCLIKIPVDVNKCLNPSDCIHSPNDSDFSTQCAGSHLVGKLWSLCKKASTKDNGNIDIYDEDAIAYAR